MSVVAIILAAGRGKRMRSKLPKPLHRLGGKPLLGWVLDAALLAGAGRHIVITPPESEAIDAFIAGWGKNRGVVVETRCQETPLGTGHAAALAQDALTTDALTTDALTATDDTAKDSLTAEDAIAVIAYADTPLLGAETLRQMAAALDESGAAVACLGMVAANPHGYGRLITDARGRLIKITEEKDATPEERKSTLVNAGVMAARLPLLFDLLADTGTDNASGEHYLTDIIAAAHGRGLPITHLEADPDEVMGINTRADLAHAEGLLQDRLRIAAMEGGATLAAPQTVFFSHDTVLEEDVMIDPHVVFGGGVHIGAGTHIKSFCHLEGVTTGACCVIGPHARLRPGTELAEGVRIGNFVEVKNAKMGAQAKANHLSYIGDATVGSKANIGAGVITCNYDGFGKHHTAIGDEAFIGSNTALIAPVSVGDRALVGAGSTITRPVEADALAVSRAEMRVSAGGAGRLKRKKLKQRGGKT